MHTQHRCREGGIPPGRAMEIWFVPENGGSWALWMLTEYLEEELRFRRTFITDIRYCPFCGEILLNGQEQQMKREGLFEGLALK